jgi:hypothetical protein
MVLAVLAGTLWTAGPPQGAVNVIPRPASIQERPGASFLLAPDTRIEDIEDIEFMAFPRLPGIAEIGWSPRRGRGWREYRRRLAAQGPRWEAQGVSFYRSPQLPWP